jgi:hypothetical protein
VAVQESPQRKQPTQSNLPKTLKLLLRSIRVKRGNAEDATGFTEVNRDPFGGVNKHFAAPHKATSPVPPIPSKVLGASTAARKIVSGVLAWGIAIGLRLGGVSVISQQIQKTLQGTVAYFKNSDRQIQMAIIAGETDYVGYI